MIAHGLALVVGGLLGTQSTELPLAFDALASVAAFLIGLTLKDPPRDNDSNDRSVDAKMLKPQGILRICKGALYDFPALRWLLLFAAFTNAATLQMRWLFQPLLVAIDVPSSWFGVVEAVVMFSVSGATTLSSQYYHRMSSCRWQFVITLLIGLGYFVFAWAQTPLNCAGFILFCAARSASGPILMNSINIVVSSDRRSTILSLVSLICRGTFAMSGPLVGGWCDTHSVFYAFGVAGSLFVPLLSASAFCHAQSVS
jgi:hypothetical protein